MSVELLVVVGIGLVVVILALALLKVGLQVIVFLLKLPFLILAFPFKLLGRVFGLNRRRPEYVEAPPRVVIHRHEPQRVIIEDQRSVAPTGGVVARHEERIIEREVLMVRCKYCQKVVRFEGKDCPNCGAPLEPA